MVRVTKRYLFSASHRLHAQQLSDEENARVFGKCNHRWGHGHNYALDVSVEGPVDARSGMIVRREALDTLVEGAVTSRLDHVNLNSDVAELSDVVPTTENLSLLIRRWLRQSWAEAFGDQPLRLAKVQVEETGRNRFEVAG